jgi:alkylation response protein AidB-like acyl-CoA dehydrogenase
MRFTFSAEEEAFRSEVHEFLTDYRDLEGFIVQGQKFPAIKKMFRALGERGWLAVGWPTEYGGMGKPPSYEYILWDEMAYARAARNPLSAGIVAKSIIRYGSVEQKAQWLDPIRSGELHFSLGYSEPEAGSDLAALRCRAERSETGYIINGQKCWQSYAHDMDYLWLLARTGDQESRGRGLSLFIVDLAAAGVTVNPLPLMDGDQLNEIFFDNVAVREDQRVGPENGAWPIMGEALADERHIQFPSGRVRRDLQEVTRWFEDHGMLRDPVVMYRLAALAVEVLEVEMHGLRVLDCLQKKRSALVEAAANKVAHTDACASIAATAMEFGAAEAIVQGSRPDILWRASIWEPIGGGTSEIMRSVVARHGLGLTGKG